jgi:signal transduction histidine kinase/CheY-like chemotaxis protein
VAAIARLRTQRPPATPAGLRLVAHVAFVAAIAAIAALGYALYVAALAALASRVEVNHTYRVLEAITAVQAQLGRAESAQRGYLVSGNDSLLREFRGAADALKASAARLKTLVSDNAAQTGRARALENAVTERIDIMRELLDVAHSAPERAAAVFDRGRQRTAGIYALTGEMQQEESRLLDERQNAEVRQFGRSLVLVAVAAAFTVLVLIPGYIGGLRQLRARERVQRELREAKDAAEAASHAKGRFLAVMSHEIRTPLSAMLGMLELLSLRKLGPDERNMLDVVQGSAKSLHRLIDDILDFSKIEAGKLEIAAAPASVHELVAEIADMYSASASSKGLLVEASVDPDVSAAHCVDALRLRQILANLVSNAVKFTERGTVRLRAALVSRGTSDETLCFSVADTGVGISGEAQKRLFAPYAQGSAQVARVHGGSGLGLAISRELAGLMGGTLEVHSEAGKGTTASLTLNLPVADRPADGKPDGALAGSPPGFVSRPAPSPADAEREGTLLLVVDDHPVNRIVLTHQLAALGYCARTAVDGVDALEQWRSRRFAAVVTDLNMPGMDGFELAQRIRECEAAHRRRRVPIIACTANAMGAQREACIGAGMDDYLRKPVTLDELGVMLQRWVPLPDPAQRFDRARLASLARDVGESSDALLEQFGSASAADLQRIRQAIADGDRSCVARTAHRMKGASRMVGLTALAGACEALEREARGGDPERIARQADAVEAELGHVEHEAAEPAR